jgi:hypothetical protein
MRAFPAIATLGALLAADVAAGQDAAPGNEAATPGSLRETICHGNRFTPP